MPIPLLQKMRMLASADATIQSYCLGTNGTFRWFDTQLPKGYVQQGTCVRVRQISSLLYYVQNGPINQDQVQVQIDVLDMSSTTAKALAAYLVSTWFPSVDFTTGSQFLSPPGPPLASPNFKLSQRSGLDYTVLPEAPYVETLTYRIWNNIDV